MILSIIIALTYLVLVFYIGCRLGRFLKDCDEDAKKIINDKRRK